VLGTSIVGPWSDGLETAVFGVGCFWGAERRLWQTAGVHVTAVGYAGGQTENPTYRDVCYTETGHAEVVLVVFDPTRVSYADLLKVFWESHDPTQGVAGEGVWANHDGDLVVGHLLLRRGVSPAVSGEESGRVLRAWWYRGGMPNWHRSCR
jgi:hypothetical protein